MDLRYDPIRKVVGGYKEVDMCLYDGVGSQSEFLGVTVRDSGHGPARTGLRSLARGWRQR